MESWRNFGTSGSRTGLRAMCRHPALLPLEPSGKQRLQLSGQPPDLQVLRGDPQMESWGLSSPNLGHGRFYHFVITAVTSDFQVVCGAPRGAGVSASATVPSHSSWPSWKAHVENLISLSEEVGGHQILSEEEQHCPTPAGSLIVDRTHFLPPSAHYLPASWIHTLLSRSVSATVSEPQTGAASNITDSI